MLRSSAFLFLLLPILYMGCDNSDEATYGKRTLRAQALAERFVIIDGHVDVPYRMTVHEEDITQSTEGGDFDYPRAVAGGLNAPFMSIYLPSRLQDRPGASRALADSLIDLVEGWVTRAPDKFAIATSVADVHSHKEAGLVSLPMGMENGSGIEDDLANVQHFYDRGIRYITLTHARDNLIGDSSYDTTGTWNGLSPFGEQVVAEMNRLGIIIDVSHITDSTFYDVIRLSKAPVFASHSSARHFTPGWTRNMSDAMIEALAAHDGVIMINFGSSFLRTEYQSAGEVFEKRMEDYRQANGLESDSPEFFSYYTAQRRANPVGTLADVVAHIDHVVNLVGIDHVGIGSDFDGVTTLPTWLQDVSEYPDLIEALLKKGYTEGDIEKVLGGNALRVWAGVERVARDGR